MCLSPLSIVLTNNSHYDRPRIGATHAKTERPVIPAEHFAGCPRPLSQRVRLGHVHAHDARLRTIITVVPYFAAPTFFNSMALITCVPVSTQAKSVLMSLLIRNVLFTIVIPGLGAVYLPWWILSRGGTRTEPAAWYAIVPIAVGAALYLWCLWLFATVGRGTPGPWDAPRRFVAVGPYRWVRNPIYISALFVIVGEALLFLSLPLLVYAAATALSVHLFVIGYEEPTLRRRFGETYVEYLQTVPRWIPRPPQSAS